MILHQIRLKNIKSYGEGPDKNGVTIPFEKGVNRVAGKNGAGKSTLIEGIGYVLFGAEPIHQENFQIDTYFLQAGKKAGEIELTFEVDGEVYRIHRGIGSGNKLRQKLIRVADGSSDAEGDNEVGHALCKLFGVTDRERLAELFTKLIGIKQGHLPLPFDSKAKGARDHFEPLMDVAIFRECHEKLKPVVDNIRALRAGLALKRATADQRLKDREDSPRRKAEAEAAVTSVTAELDAALLARAALEKTKKELEAREVTFVAAEKAQAARTLELELATGRHLHTGRAVEEARAAVQIVAGTEAGYRIYVEADQLLAKLQGQQTRRNQLQKERGEFDVQRTAAEQQARLLSDRSKSEGREATAKQDGLTTFLAEDKIAREAFEAAHPEFERQAQRLKEAEAHQRAIEAWTGEVIQAAARVSRLTGTLLENWRQISSWDRTSLEKAQAELEAANVTKQMLGEDLAAEKQTRLTLNTQLSQIAGGTCPFLKARCNQFEPAQVQGDVAQHEAKIADMQKQLKEATLAQTALAMKAKARQEEAAKMTALASELDKSVRSLLADAEPCFRAGIDGHLEVLRNQFPAIAEGLELPALARVAASALLSPETRELNFTALTIHRDAIEAFARAAGQFSPIISHEVDAERQRVTESGNQRATVRERLATNRKTIERLQIEIADLTKKAADHQQKTATADALAKSLQVKIAEVDVALREFVQLDQEIASESEKKSAQAAAHGKYLGAKPTADTLQARQTAWEIEGKAVATAQATVDLAKAALAASLEGFDRASLETAQRQFQEIAEKISGLTERKSFLVKDWQEQQKRFEEFTQAAAAARELELESGRLEAAEELTEKARTLLPKAAPAVAQSICDRITARAQQTFNSLNHEPVELKWNSENYSLRINTVAMDAGRFAMLSGGEQTKLALAMVLAMIHEFISCGFCIFDEPTYGIDTESKEKLADSIIQMQQSCRLQQLLLVSHDNAFDGKVEHVVTIARPGPGGSQAV